MCAAIKETGIKADEWLEYSSSGYSTTGNYSEAARSRWSNYDNSVKQDGNPDGVLYGHVIAFTGQLQIPRKDAASYAAQLGCEVKDGVSRKITLLVVGDQDLNVLRGETKSSKHRKAEELIASGCDIRIIRESDFMNLDEIV